MLTFIVSCQQSAYTTHIVLILVGLQLRPQRRRLLALLRTAALRRRELGAERLDHALHFG